MKEIKLKALVNDEVYCLPNGKDIIKGKVVKIRIDYSSQVTYVMKRLGSDREIPEYIEHSIVGTSKEDLIEELTKLINECKI